MNVKTASKIAFWIFRVFMAIIFWPIGCANYAVYFTLTTKGRIWPDEKSAITAFLTASVIVNAAWVWLIVRIVRFWVTQ